MIGESIRAAVENAIEPYTSSRLAALVAQAGPYVIEFVNSRSAIGLQCPTTEHAQRGIGPSVELRGPLEVEAYHARSNPAGKCAAFTTESPTAVPMR